MILIFTDQKEFPQLKIEAVAQEIKKTIHASEIEYRRLYDRRIFFFKKNGDELKIEFTHYPFTLLNRPEIINGIRIDSLEDAAANKLMALIDRIEAKDFVDLYFIIKEKNITVGRLRELVQKKFSFKIDPIALGSEFAKVGALTALPKMIKPLELDDLKIFFADRAKELKPEIFIS